MARALIAPGHAHKSHTAAKTSFATLGDKIMACALFGGNSAEMTHAHNSIPSLLEDPQFYQSIRKMFNPPAKIAKSHTAREAWVKRMKAYTHALYLRVKQGDFATLSNGAYLSSTLAQNSGASSTLFFGFDKFGEPVYEADQVAYLLTIAGSQKITKWDKSLLDPDLYEIVIYASFQIIQDTRNGINFQGCPLIMIGENAVAPAERIIYPRYDNAHESDSSMNAIVANKIKENIASTMVDIAENSPTPQALCSFLEEPGLLITKFGDLFNGLQQRKIAEYVEREWFGNSLDTKRSQIADRFASLVVTYLSLDKSYNGLARCNPTQFEEHRDVIIRMSALGTPIVKIAPVIGLLFRCNRCFIDSVSILVYGSKGSAIKGGLPAGFVFSLITSVGSECIMLYPTLGENDPLSDIDLEGYSNGSIAGTRRSEDTYYDKLIVSTRSLVVKNRARMFFLSTEKYVYGNTCVWDRENDQILTYQDLNLQGPYDDRLEVSERELAQTNWTWFNAAASRPTSSGQKSLPIDKWSDFSIHRR